MVESLACIVPVLRVSKRNKSTRGVIFIILTFCDGSVQIKNYVFIYMYSYI
jgi:hypothetical protein